MINGCQSSGWVAFTPEEIARTVNACGLLSLELELTDVCNFNCTYCYNQTGQAPDQSRELTDEEIRSVVSQAQNLGARTIILLGGEPLLYPQLGALCDWLHGRGLGIDLFTNGTHVTPAMAAVFFRNDVRVVLKMNARDAALQNRMAGCETAFETIQTALTNLRKAGYPSQTARLGISSVICRENAAEIEPLWRWARANGIDPYFERLNPSGNAVRHEEQLLLSPQEQAAVFNRLSDIDRTEFGRDWTPQPPLVGNPCLRHKYSCTVKANGDVQPCVGVTCRVGNVRERPLKLILCDSEMMDELRHFETTIKGPCARCSRFGDCYGCRGTAYQLTGDYLASDPLCWRNVDAQGEIARLPLSAEPYLAHRPPMRVVKRILSLGEKTTTVEVEVTPDALYLEPGGRADEVFFAEMVAQAFGAGIGLRNYRRNSGRPQEGLLVGIRAFHIHGFARAGERLNVDVTLQCEMDGFAVIGGRVRRGTETLAEGTINVCNQPLPTDDTEADPPACSPTGQEGNAS